MGPQKVLGGNLVMTRGHSQSEVDRIGWATAMCLRFFHPLLPGISVCQAKRGHAKGQDSAYAQYMRRRKG